MSSVPKVTRLSGFVRYDHWCDRPQPHSYESQSNSRSSSPSQRYRTQESWIKSGGGASAELEAVTQQPYVGAQATLQTTRTLAEMKGLSLTGGSAGAGETLGGSGGGGGDFGAGSTLRDMQEQSQLERIIDMQKTQIR